jgi:hypothetical protein
MMKALALLVGLKQVDPTAYGGWDGKNGCIGCELDVDNIEIILRQIGGYSINILKTKQATASAILRGVEAAALTMSSGDLFVFYYSGHGGQQPDRTGDELDGQDETLLAFDREIIDDELGRLWGLFREGVRILMISDSCNSGTNYRNLLSINKSTPIEFDQIPNMKASMIHIAGCHDGDTSAGYQAGGAMTIALCDLWQGGTFSGTYQQFFEGIVTRIKKSGETQIPEMHFINNPSLSFTSSTPFSIGVSNASRYDAKILTEITRVPISVLARPAEALQTNLRIDPFSAAVIGVAVGGALGLAGKNEVKGIEAIKNATCQLSVEDLQMKVTEIQDAMTTDTKLRGSVEKCSEGESKLFGIDDVAASAFLAGVLVGAGVVKN